MPPLVNAVSLRCQHRTASLQLPRCCNCFGVFSDGKHSCDVPFNHSRVGVGVASGWISSGCVCVFDTYVNIISAASGVEDRWSGTQKDKVDWYQMRYRNALLIIAQSCIYYTLTLIDGRITHYIVIQHLRSARCHQLSVQRVRRSTFGTRAFFVAGKRVWNSLPDHLWDPAVDPEQFRRDPKTYLFVGYLKR